MTKYTRREVLPIIGAGLATALFAPGVALAPTSQENLNLSAKTKVYKVPEEPRTKTTPIQEVKETHYSTSIITPTYSVEPLASQTSPYINYDFSKDLEYITMARVTCGECEGIILEKDNIETLMVIYTMINRAKDQFKFNGKTPKEAALVVRPVRDNGVPREDENGHIILAHQYSCLNAWDPNLEKIKYPERYVEGLWAQAVEKVNGTLDGKFSFANFGQTHYHTKTSSPDWSKNSRYKRVQSPENSKHFFYKDTKANLEEELFGLV